MGNLPLSDEIIKGYAMVWATSGVSPKTSFRRENERVEKAAVDLLQELIWI